MADQVLLYDTTLRDGMQGEGMSLSAGEKLRVAHALDSLGIHFIEAGFPSSNPKEAELFDLLSRETFAHAEVVAFGMTRRREVAAEQDEGLRVLADCFAPVCTLVGKTWSLHLEKVTRVDPEENLAMIADSVAFLVAQGKRVVYDAEHFFDAYAGDPAYSLRCLRAAVEAGAENLTLCDTNGATLPTAARGLAVDHVVAELGEHAQIGIHTHDDAGVGVANSLVAVERGARMVQGTMNGYGERCGNANLVTILADLQLKLGYDCVEPALLEHLTETAHLVDEICNVAPNPNQPYVGGNAFAHKGGMHVAGVARDARTFEHIDPAEVGADRRLLISELSGRGTVQARADQTGVELDADGSARVSERVKELESRGYHLEAADGSFDLLIRREAGDYQALFRPGVLAGDRGEARGRQGADRGHDQDLGGGRALRAHGGGQRPGARAGRGAARPPSARPIPTCATSSWSTSRCGSSTRARARARSPACCWTPATVARRGARSACPRT